MARIVKIKKRNCSASIITYNEGEYRTLANSKIKKIDVLH
jgi:hypothetical protein